MAFHERVARFKAFADRMPRSSERYRQVGGEKTRTELFVQKEEFSRRWPDLEDVFVRGRQDPGDLSEWEPFAGEMEIRAKKADYDYLRVIHGLESEWKVSASGWLQGIVERIRAQAVELMPSMR